MQQLSRRGFLETTLLSGAAAWSAGCARRQPAPHSRIRGANEDIRLAVIGTGGKGREHATSFAKLPGVRLVAICDADRAHTAPIAENFSKQNQQVAVHTDLRRVLDDPDIDAITTATPNHWHALIGIWACQAGKDAFIEKPVSHNVWEGRKLVEAARKYNRIVGAGTHNRSSQGLREAFQWLAEGNLGRIKLVRGFCYKRRPSIGKVAGPQPVPDSVDYDLWCGPAPRSPLMRSRLHYDWHWVWPTGNGDYGNQGIHEVDMCRWVLGQGKLPPRVLSLGGRFGYDDDGETPNTQLIFLDYHPAPILFEVRGLPQRAGQDAMDAYRGVRIGFVVECEEGSFAGGGSGGWVYDKAGQRVRQFASDGGAGHYANFIAAVRSRKREDLSAEIEECHLSSALCHLGNISYRLGRRHSSGAVREAVAGNAAVSEAFDRFQSHLAANEVELRGVAVTLGPWLEVDAARERFRGGSPWQAEANAQLSRSYRSPFVVPARV